MSYATVADLQIRLSDVFGELYKTLEGESMTTEAGEDLAAASAEIDGAAGVRYVVPVTAEAALPLLKSWCLTLTEELAWARSGRITPESVTARCKVVRDYLSRLLEGKYSLAGASAPEKTGSGVAVIECEPPAFGRGKMRGF